MGQEVNIFYKLASGSDPVTALLATIAVVLAGVIISMARYAKKESVPYRIHKQHIDQLNKMFDIVREDGKNNVVVVQDNNKLLQIIKTKLEDFRLRK